MRIRRQMTIATSLCLVLLGQAGMLLLGNRGWGMGMGEWKTEKLFSYHPFKVSFSANLFNFKFLKQDYRKPEINSKLIASNTKFSFQLFSQITKNQATQNIFISPASIATALAMTYNGANGQTQQAIAETLELQGLSLQDLNIANAALKETITNSDPQVQLSIANSLWAKNDKSFKPEFMERIRNFYGAEAKNINFNDPSATSIINDWAKKSTNGKINRIVDRFDPDTVFVLLNAIYFLGTWTQPFSKQATQERPFNLLDGTQKMHPMMFKVISNPKYYENEIFQTISIPYGQRRLTMYVFLPKPNVGLARFYELLTAENWNKWMKEVSNASSNYEEQEPVFLGLPRFKLEYEIELKNTLKDLGMGIAFERNADFSAMTATPLWISQVKHKTFVEVNEEGTEAAAVTMAGGIRGGIRMIVDRPFFYVIRDEQTGTILFMGSVVDPK